MTTDNSMRITNEEGRHFNVRIVRIGDRYGRDDCLTHGEDKDDNSPLVEFYDLSHTAKFGPRGQFVSRYYVSTLLGRDEYVCNKGMEAEMGIGLNLEGGVAAWSIDADAMDVVRSWLDNQTEGEV